MKILYVASDQHVPGRTGGSVHVEEVARQLSQRGHEVHVVALPGDGRLPAGVELHPSPMWIEHRIFRWTARRGVGEILDRFDIDAVMERYYNFAGEGVRAAYPRGIPALLEINAPLVEYPGSLKNTLDKLALVRPMARLRDEICRKAGALVTPLPDIVPSEVPREKVHKVNWGANVDRFHADVERKPLPIPEGRDVVVFSGSFRPWHGADVLVRAAAELPDLFFLFLGDGPTWRDCRDLAERLGISARVLYTGAVAYDEMPAYLKWATVGVAPYQPRRLKQMQLGFFWSPLKIFEYMAMGLPVVCLDVPPLADIIRPGREGALVEEGDASALARAIDSILREPSSAAAMGRAARERVVAEFSWQRHCEQLEAILDDLVRAQRE